MPEMIMSRPTTPEYREGWERAFGCRKPGKPTKLPDTRLSDTEFTTDILAGVDPDTRSLIAAEMAMREGGMSE